MKAMILGALMFVSQAALADYGPSVDSRTMTCADLQAVVQAHKATFVTGNWGGNWMYATDSQCGFGQRANFGYVRTADKGWCFAGYVCESYNDR